MRKLKALFAIFIFGVFSTTYAGIKSGSRRMCNRAHCYFISQGVAYKGNKPTASDSGKIYGKSLPGSFNVKSLIIYRGQLVVLQNNGKVWVWATDRSNGGHWVQIARNGKRLYADNHNLYLVTKGKKLFMHDNHLNITYTVYKFAGSVQGIARNVFFNTDQEDVKRLEEKDGQTIVVHEDGEKTVCTFSGEAHIPF